MFESRNAIAGKIYTDCDGWKPLDDPTDPTPPSRGRMHCRRGAANRRNASRKVKAALAVLAVCVSVSIPAASKDKPVYQTGKLLELTVQDVGLGTEFIGGMSVPVSGKLYLFQIQVDNFFYFAEYKTRALSNKPEWVVNDSIELRLGKENKVFLKRPNGKEVEVVVSKRCTRSESNDWQCVPY